VLAALGVMQQVVQFLGRGIVGLGCEENASIGTVDDQDRVLVRGSAGDFQGRVAPSCAGQEMSKYRQGFC
jgi:hypothetical protein